MNCQTDLCNAWSERRIPYGAGSNVIKNIRILVTKSLDKTNRLKSEYKLLLRWRDGSFEEEFQLNVLA